MAGRIDGKRAARIPITASEPGVSRPCIRQDYSGAVLSNTKSCSWEEST